MKRILVIGALAGAITASVATPQKPVLEPDLAKVAAGEGWKVFNRSASTIEEGGKRGVRLDQKLGDGMARLEGYDFINGTIEFDVRGKDVFQGSFVGVAFHALDEKTYDAIYFRPFNFRSDDAARRSHGVQYISHPANTWQKLRSEQPGIYEKPVEPPPDPNAWFHARVVINKPKVSVFVNDAKIPCLTVEQLSDRKGGWVGFWVGNGSGGDFANLKISPAR